MLSLIVLAATAADRERALAADGDAQRSDWAQQRTLAAALTPEHVELAAAVPSPAPDACSSEPWRMPGCTCACCERIVNSMNAYCEAERVRRRRTPSPHPPLPPLLIPFQLNDCCKRYDRRSQLGSRWIFVGGRRMLPIAMN